MDSENAAVGTPRAAGQGREIAGPVAPAVDGMSPDGFALAPRDIRVRTLADGRIGRFAVVTALTIVVVAAVGLRFVDLASNPGGLYPDEAAEGLAARRILHEPGFLPVWFVEDGGREALFAYLVSAVFRLAGETIVALRAAAAAIGVAGVVAIWLLARRFGSLAGLAAAGWAAGSLWLVCVSRDGMRNVLVPLFGALALVVLLQWQARPTRRAALVAGAVTALAALYTYQPLRLLPIALIAWLAWLRVGDRPAYDRLRPGFAVLASAFLVVAAPMIVTAVGQPASFFGRAAAVSPFNPDVASDDDLLGHVLRTVGMFALTGDPNGRHDVGGLPLFGWQPLGWLLLAVAVLGVLRLGRAWREPRAALVLVALVVFLVPPLVAVEGGSPHFLRALGLAAPLGVAVGVGAEELRERLVAWRGRTGGFAAVAGLAALLAGTAVASGVAYLGRPAADRVDAYGFGVVALAQAARTGDSAVVVIDDYRATVVRFIAGDAATVVSPSTPRSGGSTGGGRVLALDRGDLARSFGPEVAARAQPLSQPGASGGGLYGRPNADVEDLAGWRPDAPFGWEARL